MVPKATKTPSSSSQATQARQVIGPLTTLFHPPYQCSQCTFIGAATDPAAVTYSEICAVFNQDIACAGAPSPPRCLPHVTDYSDVAGPGYFYSPAVLCPDGWSTAAKVTADSNADGFVDGVNVKTLWSGETAVVCCPSGFTYVPSEETLVAGYCRNGVVENPASYRSCTGSSPLREVTKTDIGRSTAISYKRINDEESTYMKTTTLLFTSVEQLAPTIQLNHRRQDQSLSTSATANDGVTGSGQPSASHASDTIGSSHGSKSLSKGAIAGIVVGVLAFLAGMTAVALLARRRMRKKRETQAAETSYAATEKPELEAPSKPHTLPPFAFPERTLEVGSTDIHPVELDGGNPPRYSRVVESQVSAPQARHTRNNLSDASAVSELSGDAEIARSGYSGGHS